MRLFLRVASVPHEYEEVDIFAPRESRSEEFRRSARFSEVPTLIDGDRAFVQSNAILVHLAQKMNGFGAEDSHRYSRTLEWLFWEANKIGMCLPQLRASKKFEDARLNSGAEDWLRRRFDHDINVMETALSQGHRYIVDDNPTIADFSLCGYLFFADEAEVHVPGHVRSWLDRIADLEGWAHPYEL